MAIRRRLGRLADTMLQHHLGRRQAEFQSDLVKQRQLELAQQRQEEIAKQAQVNRDYQMLERVLGDKTGGMAAALQRANIKIDGYDLNALIPTEDQIRGTIASGFSSKADELPSDVGIQDLLRSTARPDMAKDPRYVAPLMQSRDSKRQAILGGIGETKRAEAVPGPVKSIRPDGTEQTDYMTPFEAAEGGPLQTGLTAGQEASRAGQKAGAETRARLAAELAPDVVEKKLDFEHRKAMKELLLKGAQVQAEETGKRNAAVKGLLPTYNQYRELAVEVSQAVKDNPQWLKSGVDTLGKLPWIGEFLSSGAESLDVWVTQQGVDLGFVPPDMAQKLSLLNQLTDTLAQGMANAVLGNRGQTTENDRRTAKNILISSLTSSKTAVDLLSITDKMFTMLPIVAGQAIAQDPFKPVDEILIDMWKRHNPNAELEAPAASPEQPPVSTDEFINQPFPQADQPPAGPTARQPVPAPTIQELINRPPRQR